jgi:hypothetical protein
VKYFTIIALSLVVSLVFVYVTPFSYADTIQGHNIPKNTPFGCKTYSVTTPQQDNRIHVSLNAYAYNTDVNVVIQIDGKTMKNQILPMQTWMPVSGTFEISEKYSHTLGICLLKTFAGTDKRALGLDFVKWDTSKVSPPPVILQKPTSQNTCPSGTTIEVRGLDIVCIPTKTVEKTCPNGTYLGVDNQGNSACISFETNNEQVNDNNPVTPQKTQEPTDKPFQIFDGNSLLLIIIAVIVIVIVIVAKKNYRPKIDDNTMYSSATGNYTEKRAAKPSRVESDGLENPNFALKQFDFSKGLERVIELTYNKEKTVDVKLFFSSDKEEWSTFVRNYTEKVKDNFIRLKIDVSRKTYSSLISGGNYSFNDDFDIGYSFNVSMKYGDDKLMHQITTILRANNFGCLPATKFTVDAHRNYEHPTKFEAEQILASITDMIYQKLT